MNNTIMTIFPDQSEGNSPQAVKATLKDLPITLNVLVNNYDGNHDSFSIELVAQPSHGFEPKSNYPNPFNPETRISFSLPEKQEVFLTIYNIAGQVVARRIHGEIFKAERISFCSKP